MSATHIIPAERIERRILFLRGQKVMLDFQLAERYEVETRALNQAVARNLQRFPEDFMFQLGWEKTQEVLRSQIVILNSGTARKRSKTTKDARSQIATLKRGQHAKFRSYTFTEQGVAMLSSVLRSQRAVQVNIAIMRAFVQLRQMLASNAELARKLEALEDKYDKQFKVVFEAIRELMAQPEPLQPEHGREIGFHFTAPPAIRRRRSQKRIST
jgi:uncharacterized membrane protein YccC